MFCFSGGRTENDHFPGGKVQVDAGLRGHPGGVAISRKLACIQHGKLRLPEIFQFFLRWSYEHVVHEQGMIRPCTNDPHFQSVLRMPPGKPVKDKDALTGTQVIHGALSIDGKGVLVKGDVYRAPPNVPFRGRFTDDAFVSRAPARLGTTGCG